MRIVIIGSSSVVGHWIEMCLRKEHEVVILGRASSPILDLSLPESDIHLPDEIDVIINCSAKFEFKNAQEVDLGEAVNIQGPLRLLRAAKIAGARHFIQISTIYAEPSAEGMIGNVYAAQKRRADELLFKQENLNGIVVTSLRPTAIYGPLHFHARHQPFLHHLIENAINGRPIILAGKHDPKRNFLHISDFARIVEAVIQTRPKGIHPCPGETVSYSEIAWMAMEAFRSGSSVAFDPTLASLGDRIPEINLDLYNALGVFPRVTMRSWLELESELRGIRN
jgi:nucleoside-diphosphate-sugar epimerase